MLRFSMTPILHDQFQVTAAQNVSNPIFAKGGKDEDQANSFIWNHRGDLPLGSDVLRVVAPARPRRINGSFRRGYHQDRRGPLLQGEIRFRSAGAPIRPRHPIKQESGAASRAVPPCGPAAYTGLPCLLTRFSSGSYCRA